MKQHTERLLDPKRTGHEAGRLEEELKNRIVGQDEAVRQVVNTYQTYLAGMNSPGRPIGNLLFLGPTGTGKTRLVEALAESLVGDAKAVLRIDCGEFQHGHEIAKLVGSPPGYLGHRETHPALSQTALNQYHTRTMKISFLLFDEIEKAGDSLWKLMLGILDKASLTLGDNSKVDFSSTMVFMTSNLGAADMQRALRPGLGFAPPQIAGRQKAGQPDPEINAKLADIGTAAARLAFSPEFINRIDRVLTFRPLGESQLRRILELELNLVQQRIIGTGAKRMFVLSPTQSAKEHLLRTGTDIRYGVRYLRRTIDRALVEPLSNLIASGQVGAGDVIRVNYSPKLERMTFSTPAQAPAGHAFSQPAGRWSIGERQTVGTDCGHSSAECG
jgi:ATP-dependent Clp protease ATP-binding subunit ClpA